MPRRARRSFPAEFKTQVVLDLITGRRTQALRETARDRVELLGVVDGLEAGLQRLVDRLPAGHAGGNRLDRPEGVTTGMGTQRNAANGRGGSSESCRP